MLKKYCNLCWVACFVFLLFSGKVVGQELNAKVTVISDRIKDVDPSTFNALQEAIISFLNTRKWTTDAFQGEERINCNFVLNILSDINASTFSAQLTVQSSRPVFDADYSANMLDDLDKDVTFKYQTFQPL
ncbi:MAG: type IX secretion component PorD family protein, partial [Chitinophagaceae bacterium]